jgi:hypothetical protein
MSEQANLENQLNPESLEKLATLPNLEQLKLETQNLAQTIKTNLGEVKRLAINEAWKILQGTASEIVILIEKYAGESVVGADKKTLALHLIEKLYDTVFIAVDLPLIPSIFEGLIHKYIKKILLLMVSSSIDVIVSTFNKIGYFKKTT